MNYLAQVLIPAILVFIASYAGWRYALFTFSLFLFLHLLEIKENI